MLLKILLLCSFHIATFASGDLLLCETITVGTSRPCEYNSINSQNLLIELINNTPREEHNHTSQIPNHKKMITMWMENFTTFVENQHHTFGYIDVKGVTNLITSSDKLVETLKPITSKVMINGETVYQS